MDGIKLDAQGCARIGGKDYVKVGDKMAECTFVNGKPVVRAVSKTIKHADGRQDVTVQVPCLQIAGHIR